MICENDEKILILENKDFQTKSNKKKFKSINKALYLISIFSFGFIGFHKFYTGKITSGFLYLIFAFTLIPLLLSYIEFFKILSKKADKNGDILV